MGGAYIHGHEPRRGSVVIVNVGIDIVVSKSGVYGGEQSLRLSPESGEWIKRRMAQANLLSQPSISEAR